MLRSRSCPLSLLGVLIAGASLIAAQDNSNKGATGRPLAGFHPDPRPLLLGRTSSLSRTSSSDDHSAPPGTSPWHNTPFLLPNGTTGNRGMLVPPSERPSTPPDSENALPPYVKEGGDASVPDSPDRSRRDPHLPPYPPPPAPRTHL
ncbi:hypothetical protein DFH06DRAFT_1472287 [Mycena polygramma]|nr:hypothetical protein DFH06DRAFT_1472287 [Mycena polygramma]